MLLNLLGAAGNMELIILIIIGMELTKEEEIKKKNILMKGYLKEARIFMKGQYLQTVVTMVC